TFVSNYELAMATVEAGVRIAARLGPDSKHALSSQATIGIGLGNYEEHTTGLTPIAISGNLTETAEFALGYTYLWTESFSIGARVRAFLFKIDAEGGRPPNMFGERVGGAFAGYATTAGEYDEPGYRIQQRMRHKSMDTTGGYIRAGQQWSK